MCLHTASTEYCGHGVNHVDFGHGQEGRVGVIVLWRAAV